MHALHWIVEEENVNRTAVMDRIRRHAEQDGDCGYSSRFTWHDKVAPLASLEEAEKFISAHDRHFYDDHAVRFYDYSGATKTAKITEYETKVSEFKKAKSDYIKEHSVKKFQAKHIGCPKCGSKLNKNYLNYDKCPLCGTDLRSKTTLEKIKWFDEKIKDYQSRIETEKRKQKNKAKIKWLIKYEYHC